MTTLAALLIVALIVACLCIVSPPIVRAMIWLPLWIIAILFALVMMPLVLIGSFAERRL